MPELRPITDPDADPHRTPHDLASFVALERYAFPGGYELYAITDDGAVLCNDCCRTEIENIGDSLPGDGWHVLGFQCTDADDGIHGLACDHCNRWIVDVDPDLGHLA